MITQLTLSSSPACAEVYLCWESDLSKVRGGEGAESGWGWRRGLAGPLEDCLSWGGRVRGLKIGQSGWGGGMKSAANSKAKMSSWAFPAPGLCSEHVQLFTRLS